MGLTARGVSAGYGTVSVIESVDLAVAEGEVLAVVGPNGSGKTTLLRALSGTLPLSAGTVLLGGSDLANLPSRERARRLAVVPQATPFEFAFTVREVVEMGRTPYLRGLRPLSETDRKAVDGALADAGVVDLEERASTELSAGQAQLVAIARALAQQPRVLLLDEPTAHLDVAHQIEIMEAVRNAVRESRLACVAVLHDLNLAATFADRILLVSKGRVRACGTPGAVLTRALVASTFGVDVLVRRHPVSGALFVVPLSLSLDDQAGGHEHAPHPRVHIVCGGGTGAPLMGELVRRGAEVSVGVVNVLDTDFEVAEGMGLRVVAEAPFSEITPTALEEARRLALAADVVVLTAVPLGRSNLANLSLVDAAVEAGKTVYIVDGAGVAGRDFVGGGAATRIAALLAPGAPTGVRAVASTDELLQALRTPTPLPGNGR